MRSFTARALPLTLGAVLLVTFLAPERVVSQPQQQQPMAGACSASFFSALVQMIPCRAAVAPFSPIPPSEACCTAVKTLGQPCLCVLANGPPLSGVDRNMALQLPERCSANFPPCDVIN